MNKQGNTYTIIYAAVMVIVVAAILAFTAMSLKPAQEKNIAIDKMKQILTSVNIPASATDAQALYEKYITSMVIDASGKTVEGNAFNINISEEINKPEAERTLPVFICTTDNGERKYILPVYGAGLWGPIWGYISVDTNGSTIYGSYFAHQGETPGLGAEIEKTDFQKQFEGKNLFIDGTFKSIAVEKAGQKPVNGADYVDAISGGTITSKGVQSMLERCLSAYQMFLKSLN